MSMTESERLTQREDDELYSIYLRKALIERLAEYEDIGTVSEFRELKEKATAKTNIKYCKCCGRLLTLNHEMCYRCGTRN